MRLGVDDGGGFVRNYEGLMPFAKFLLCLRRSQQREQGEVNLARRKRK